MASTSTAHLGCAHYRCGCKVVCSQCHQAYWCRFCHDDAQGQDHVLDRSALQAVECGVCLHRQPPPAGPSGQCAYCGQLFGRYCCPRCSVFDLEDKEQFHCPDCGICRKGGRENFSHCHQCGYCIQNAYKDCHQHREDALGVTCLLCCSPQILPDSTEGATVLVGCGHAFHTTCLRDAFGALETLCPVCYLSRNPAVSEDELLHVAARQLSLEAAPSQPPLVPKAAPWLSGLVLQALPFSRQPRFPAFIDIRADRVRPLAQEMRAGRAATTAVVLAAQHLPSFSLDRVCIGGSTGRKVNVKGDLDVDLVLFVNEEVSPPLRRPAFQELAAALRRLYCSRVRNVLVRKEALKLEFKVMRTWVPMDISITQNLVGEAVPPGRRGDAQQEAVLHRVLSRSPPQHKRDDDAALCESMAGLMAAAPGQVNDAVRLAKCWAKYLHQEGLLPACKYPPLSAADCLAGFLRVLPVLASGDEHLIILKFYSLEQAHQMKPAWGTSSERDPVVLHPVNPSNNMAQRIPRAGWAQLAQRAQQLWGALTDGGEAAWEASTLNRAVQSFG